jgi:hypothetical protein
VIRVTGGVIEPDKSFWYLIDFVWHHSTWRYATDDDCLAKLSVLDLNGNHKVLQCLPVMHAEQMLGIQLAPDGMWNEEFKYLILQGYAVLWKQCGCAEVYTEFSKRQKRTG